MGVIALALFLAGCKRLDSGVVIDKAHTPAHVQTYTTLNRVGKSLIPMVRTRVVPARYTVLVQGQDKDGDTVTEWWSITHEEYNRVQIGGTVHRRD